MKTRFWFRSTPAILVIVLALLLVAGCSSASTTPSTGGPPAPATPPAVATAAAPTASAKSSASKTPGPEPGGTLKIGSSYEPGNLGYPAKMSSGPEPFIASPVVESLVQMNKAGALDPWLAESWKIDTAAKTLTLSLKKGVKFHDGTDFNAAAVKFNLDLFRAAGGWLKPVSSIDVVDDSTVRLNFSSTPTTGTLFELSQAPGLIISPTALQKNGEAWAVKNPVGTGPFKFDSWQSGVKVVFKRFDSYWQKGKPYLDALEWDIFANPMTARASFLAGEIDVYHGASIEDVTAIQAAGNYGLYTMPIAVIGMAADSANPSSPFAKLQVRQAVSYAIDSQAISKGVGKGKFPVTNQIALPGSWGFSADVKGYPYDPARAKQLLAEAGYPNGFKTTLTAIGIGFYQDIFTAVQGYLKDVGIDATLDVAPPPRYGPMLQSGWQGLIMTGLAWWDPASMFTNEFTVESAKNDLSSMARPSDLNDLAIKAAAETDTTAQQKLVWEAQKSVVDKHALVNMMFLITGYAVYHQDVHDSEINNINVLHYTPQNAWKEKK